MTQNCTRFAPIITSTINAPLPSGAYIAGVDEAGRGALVGAVVAAAVVLNPQQPIDGLKDSKKCTATQRDFLFDEITQKAAAYSIGAASWAEIDELNILNASLLAMRRAVLALNALCPLQEALIDGNRLPDLSVPARAIVGGDDLVPAISAASILAKVCRDRQMHALHQQHPQYGFASHKGYPTKAHLAALQQHGILAQHRRSFAPVRAFLE